MLLKALYEAESVYFNYNKVENYCVNLAGSTGGTGNLGDGDGWDVLSCSEVCMPTIYGDKSIFPN